MWRAGLFAIALTACAFPHGAVGASDDASVGVIDGDGDALDAVDAPPSPPCPDYGGGPYRLVATASGWQDAEKVCAADAPGSTHLVVLDDDAERAAVTTAIQALPGDAWVGIVRDPGGTAPWPWRFVIGGDAGYAPWEVSEPNNMSGDQYVAGLRKTSGFLYDYGPDNLLYSVCECDQRPPINADYDPSTN